MCEIVCCFWGEGKRKLWGKREEKENLGISGKIFLGVKGKSGVGFGDWNGEFGLN